jgi:hypothetical protein
MLIQLTSWMIVHSSCLAWFLFLGSNPMFCVIAMVLEEPGLTRVHVIRATQGSACDTISRSRSSNQRTRNTIAWTIDAVTC